MLYIKLLPFVLTPRGAMIAVVSNFSSLKLSKFTHVAVVFSTFIPMVIEDSLATLKSSEKESTPPVPGISLL